MTTTAGKQHRSVHSAVATGLSHGAGTLLAVALLPLCLAIGVPLAAWVIAFALVVGNRLLHAGVAFAVRDSSITIALGAMGMSTIFRALLTALTLFFVGASVGASGDAPIGMDRPDLARPALLIFVLCFTLDAGIETVRRAAQREELPASEPPPATPRETTA